MELNGFELVSGDLFHPLGAAVFYLPIMRKGERHYSGVIGGDKIKINPTLISNAFRLSEGYRYGAGKIAGDEFIQYFELTDSEPLDFMSLDVYRSQVEFELKSKSDKIKLRHHLDGGLGEYMDWYWSYLDDLEENNARQNGFGFVYDATPSPTRDLSDISDENLIDFVNKINASGGTPVTMFNFTSQFDPRENRPDLLYKTVNHLLDTKSLRVVMMRKGNMVIRGYELNVWNQTV